jgi:hypothetical protein
MYKVSLINRTVVDNNQLVIIVPELTKYFESMEDAQRYSVYLIETKYTQGFMPDVEQISFTQNLDVTQLKRQDAISKLSPEELALLGITY